MVLLDRMREQSRFGVPLGIPIDTPPQTEISNTMLNISTDGR